MNDWKAKMRNFWEVRKTCSLRFGCQTVWRKLGVVRFPMEYEEVDGGF